MAVYTGKELVVYGMDKISSEQICISVRRNNKTYPDLEIFAEKGKGFRFIIDPVYDLIDRRNIEK